jgi:hypothetical protein
LLEEDPEGVTRGVTFLVDSYPTLLVDPSVQVETTPTSSAVPTEKPVWREFNAFRAAG